MMISLWFFHTKILIKSKTNVLSSGVGKEIKRTDAREQSSHIVYKDLLIIFSVKQESPNKWC